nr:hypothetical protein [Synergistaceae bacterium]
MRYDRSVLGEQAKKSGFVRDTFEKMVRLTDVLRFIHSEESRSPLPSGVWKKNLLTITRRYLPSRNALRSLPASPEHSSRNEFRRGELVC